MISEERLRMAAIQAGKALADSLPEECEHTFSPAFEKKMDRLLRKSRRGKHWGLKRAALFFLAVCLAGGTWLTVDAQAREDLTGWLYGKIQAAYEEEAAIPPGLTQPVTQELYDQYQAIVDQVNEEYDLNLVLRPMEDIGPNEMGHLESFRSDVEEMREIALEMRESSGGPHVSLDAGEKLSRRLFGNPFLGIQLDGAGMGAKEAPTTTEYYAGRYGLEWTLSPIILVNCPVGPDPVYYIEDVSALDMVPTSLPIGFSAVADGSAWCEFYENDTHCAIFQRFVLTKNLVSGVVTPWVVYHIDPENGILDYGSADNVGEYQVKPGRPGFEGT